MMKTRTVEITVGALMICAIASFLMLAIQVSGLNNIFKKDDGYILTSQFSNIGGLKVRSQVSIAGVNVGRVHAINLDKDNYHANVVMMIEPNIQLPEDTQASILTAGLLGDNYVGLSPGFSKEILKKGGVIPLEQTESALVLEQLISKFVAGNASNSSKPNR